MGGTTEGCLVNSIFMPRGVPTGTWEFCHKFAFDAIQGMIFRREQRGIIRERDDGDQFHRRAFSPRSHSDGRSLVFGILPEHAPRRRTHGRTGVELDHTAIHRWVIK